MILSTAYLAPISWYSTFFNGNCEVEIWESFQKQSLRNRCRIAGPNGVQVLTVPVCKCESKQLTKDVKISYQSRWQHQHLEALKSAYRHTPYYDYFIDFFEPVYAREHKYLIELNESLHQVVMKLIGQKADLTYTKDFKGVDELPQKQQNEYYQIFADRQGFQRDMSIIDLLFNMGAESPLYL